MDNVKAGAASVSQAAAVAKGVVSIFGWGTLVGLREREIEIHELNDVLIIERNKLDIEHRAWRDRVAAWKKRNDAAQAPVAETSQDEVETCSIRAQEGSPAAKKYLLYFSFSLLLFLFFSLFSLCSFLFFS